MNTRTVVPSSGRRSIAFVSAGLSQPSSTSLLANRLASAASDTLSARGVDVEVTTIELRQHASDLTDNLLTFFDLLDDGALSGTPVPLGAGFATLTSDRQPATTGDPFATPTSFERLLNAS